MPSAATACAISRAVIHAQASLEAGRLITSEDALALAGPAAREKDTLFSIARSEAWLAEVEIEPVLRGLEARFPTFD